MEAQKIDILTASMKDKLTAQQRYMLREVLVNTPDERFAVLVSLPYKSPFIALVISLLVGYLGIDRFYLGDTGLGVAKLLTCGGFGVWTLVDWFLVMKRAKEKNFELLMNYV